MSNEYVTDYVIYKRKNNPNYSMRFSVRDHGQVRLSLKTNDLNEAHHMARREHMRYQLRAEDGTYSPPKRFESVAEEYIKDLSRRVQNGLIKAYRAHNEPSVVRRYFYPQFGNHQIGAITEAMIQKFILWRFSFWVDGPGKDIQKIEYRRGPHRLFNKVKHKNASVSTVRSNCAVLSNIFKFAAVNGYMRSSDIPRIRLPPPKPNPRP